MNARELQAPQSRPMRAEKIRPPSFIEPLWSFCAPRPAGSPPSGGLAVQIANFAHWIAGRRPDPGEWPLADRLVNALVREDDEIAAFEDAASHAEQIEATPPSSRDAAAENEL
jgi:hypothetical protein